VLDTLGATLDKCLAAINSAIESAATSMDSPDEPRPHADDADERKEAGSRKSE